MRYGVEPSRLYLLHEHQLRFVIEFERYLCDCSQPQGAMALNGDHHLRDSLHSMVSTEPTNGLRHQNVRPPIVRLCDIHPLARASYYRRLNLMAFSVPNFVCLDWHHVVIKLLNGTKRCRRKRRKKKQNENENRTTELLCKIQIGNCIEQINASCLQTKNND